MPYISSLPITTISTRQQGPCTAKLFITLRGGQKHAWFLHSMPLPFFCLSLMQRNSRVERMIYRPSLHHCVAIAGDVASTSSNYYSGVEVGFWAEHCSRPDGCWLARRAYGGKGGWHPGAPCITWDVFVYTFIYISGQQGNVSQR